MIFSIHVTFSCPLYELDVRNAFLHNDLQKELYIKITTWVYSWWLLGLLKGMSVENALYDLPELGLTRLVMPWLMVRYGYKRCEVDHTLFVK